MRCDTTFSSVIVGSYTVRLDATDAMGRTVSCVTTITLTGQGLRVELSWTTTGDVDLHLLHPTATAWFMSPLDCYYANTTPTWDGAVPASPRLDVDNVVAMGPGGSVDGEGPPPRGGNYSDCDPAVSRLALRFSLVLRPTLPRVKSSVTTECPGVRS
jgi:hypothetical protein